MTNCSVAHMSARPAGYRMPGSSSHIHYSSTSQSYGNTYDTSWKNYGSSSRPLISRTSSNITEYKPSYLPAARTSSVPLSVKAGLLTHNFGTKLSYPSKFARERREGSESSSVNTTSRLLKETNTAAVSALNGYAKYLEGRRTNAVNSTSVGDVTKYSPKYHKYSLNTLPLRSNVGKTPLRSASSSLLELESPTVRRTSMSYASSENRSYQIDSLSEYYDKSSSPNLDNYTSRMTVDRKISKPSSVDGLSTVSVPSSFKEERTVANNTENSPLTKNEMGLLGIQNIGNTCFLNSVFQCLSNTKPLLDYILNDEFLSDINFSSNMGGALIKAFSDVIQKLWQVEIHGKHINPTAFKNQIQRFAPRFMGYNQQDAQEFLRYLLEGLHEDVNRVKTKSKCMVMEIDEKLSPHEKSAAAWKCYLRRDNSKIVDLFVGQLKSTLSCTSCGNCSITFDPFWDLSLPIPERRGSVGITQCLDLFTREEVLDGEERPECSACKKRQRSTKSFSVQKFPKILVLHLKRFSTHQEGNRRGKLNLKVELPINDLDLRAYAANDGMNCSYNLYGVVYHSGTTRSGHYVSSCKHPHSGKWHEYNDTRVSPLMTQSIVTNEAYLLFYEMIQKK